MKPPIESRTRVRFIPHADEMAAKGVDLGNARGTVTGTVVPLQGEALRELEKCDRVLRRWWKGVSHAPDRDRVVAILRDDATPDNRYQFAAPEDLLPALA